MQRHNVLAAVLLVLVSGIVVTAGYAKGWGPLGVLNYGLARLTSERGQIVTSDNLESDATSPTAPEFAPGTWINSEPVTIKSLTGRVVLVEFWTFGCYNCRNTLPFVKRWHERYGDKGLTIVGVHSPEFENEKVIDNLRRQVASLDIRFPVVTDNDYETWRAYKVEAWPTVFLLDKSGRVRWKHVGEGAYEETERTIEQLLNEEKKAAATTGLEKNSN